MSQLEGDDGKGDRRSFQHRIAIRSKDQSKITGSPGPEKAIFHRSAWPTCEDQIHLEENAKHLLVLVKVIDRVNDHGREISCGGIQMHDDRISHPERTNATGAYSDGVLCDGWLYISGQGALDQKTGKIVEGSIEDQVRLTMKNIGQILEAAGCTFDDLVKCTCHLKNIEDFDVFRSRLRRALPAETSG